MATTQAILPVARGFAYGVRVRVTGDGDPLFPVGCALRAEVRDSIASPLAGALTTEEGSILRVDDTTIDLHLSSEVTAALGNSSASLDIVRTDVSPDVWLGVQVRLPIVTPITKPGADA